MTVLGNISTAVLAGAFILLVASCSKNDPNESGPGREAEAAGNGSDHPSGGTNATGGGSSNAGSDAGKTPAGGSDAAAGGAGGRESPPGGATNTGIVLNGCTYDSASFVEAPTDAPEDGRPLQLPDEQGPVVPGQTPITLEGSGANADELVLALETDPSGGIFVLTATASESVLHCYDRTLDTVWRVSQPNPDDGLALRDIAVSSDGNIVAIGDAGVMKYSAEDGETIWSDPTAAGHTIVSAPDGSTIGIARNPVASVSLFRHTADGSLAWQNQERLPLAATFDDEGNVYVSYSAGYLSYVVKYDIGGSEVWRTLGEQPSDTLTYGFWIASAPGVPVILLRGRSYGGAIGAMAPTGELLWYREFGSFNPSSCSSIYGWQGTFKQDTFGGTLSEVEANAGYVSPMLVTSDGLYVSGLYQNQTPTGSYVNPTVISITNFVARYDFSGNVQWFDEFDVVEDTAPSVSRGTYGIDGGFMASLPDDQLVVIERAIDTSNRGGWVFAVLSTEDGRVVTSAIPGR